VEASGTGTPFATFVRLYAILLKYGEIIRMARLSNWFKSHFYIFWVLPKVDYTLGIWVISCHQRERLDLRVRKYAKSSEGMRATVTNGMVHAPQSIGGLGFPSFHISALQHFAMS
jgi:hypothetical protein